MNRTITLDIDTYKKLTAMLESNPSKAKEILRRAASPVLKENFYEMNGKMTFSDIADNHLNVDGRRLPILLEAWGIIRPWYNPADKSKAFRYYRVNAELLDPQYTDESMRGTKKPNEANPADGKYPSMFVDPDGNVHLMKFFTREGAEFVSKQLVEHGYPVKQRVEVETADEQDVRIQESTTREQEPSNSKPTFTEREIAILALTLSESVHVDSLKSLSAHMESLFGDEANFSFSTDNLENVSYGYIKFGTDNILRRGKNFYPMFNDEFKDGGVFADDSVKDLADRISKAMSENMEGWVE